MKTHRLFVITIALSALFLGGCAAETVQVAPNVPATPQGQTTTFEPATPTQGLAIPQEGSTTTQEENNAKEPEVKTYSRILYGKISSSIEDKLFTPELDILFETAVKTRDASYCEKFPSELIQQCKTDIQDLNNIVKGELTLDTTYCSKILSKERAELCTLEIQKRIAISKNNEPSDDEITLMNEAVSKNDINLCDKISNAQFRDNCITNVQFYNKK
jgi:hypothetical protein